MPNENTHRNSLIWFSILGIFVLRVLVLSRLQLVPDEMYYWDWHRFLSFGYFDHPPMIAWLVHLNTLIFGDTYWGIKAVPLLASFCISVIAFFLGRRYLKFDLSILLLIVLVNFTFIFAIGGMLLTPDIPLLVFWGLGLLLTYKALFEKNVSAWVFLGIVIGFGLLSKNVFVLFGLSLALTILMDRDHRQFLKTWKPWVALIVAFLIFVPNLIWNSQNGWVSIVFQLKHGFNSSGPWPRFDFLVEYLLSQIGLFSPFMVIILIMSTVLVIRKYLKNKKLVFLIIFSYVPILFFAWSSLSKRVEANWPAPAFLAGLVLAVWFWEQIQDKKITRGFWIFAVSFSCLSTVIAILHSMFTIFSIPAQKDRTFEQRGWDMLAKQVYQVRKAHDPNLEFPVCTDTYQLASVLAFYGPGQPRTWALNLHTRTNHYDFIKERSQSINDTLFYVMRMNEKWLFEKTREDFSYFKRLANIERKMTEDYKWHYAIFKAILNSEAKERIKKSHQSTATQRKLQEVDNK